MSKRVAICGIDGSGKTTLAKSLYQHYKTIGINVDIAKVNFNCKSIMENAGIDQFSSSEAQKIARIGMSFDFVGYYNSLKSSADLILCDRYDICYRVLNKMDNIGDSLVDLLGKIYDTIDDADLYVYCNITANEAARRLDKRGNRDDGETDIILQRLLDLYQEELSKKKDVVCLNAAQSKNNVLSEAIEKIDKYLRCAND